MPEREKMEINSRENVPVSDKTDSPWQRFCSTTYNAANFGFANRLFLGLMLQRAVTDKVRPYEMKLLYDSPTTYLERGDGGQELFHSQERACSARGMEGWRERPLPTTGSR